MLFSNSQRYRFKKGDLYVLLSTLCSRSRVENCLWRWKFLPIDCKAGARSVTTDPWKLKKATHAACVHVRTANCSISTFETNEKLAVLYHRYSLYSMAYSLCFICCNFRMHLTAFAYELGSFTLWHQRKNIFYTKVVILNPFIFIYITVNWYHRTFHIALLTAISMFKNVKSCELIVWLGSSTTKKDNKWSSLEKAFEKQWNSNG